MKIVTHDGRFHTDEVFAIAILKMVYPNAKIVRTRKKEEFAKADFRIDVGDRYNPKKGDFDHHQIGFNEKRKNNIPYASAGLVWKNFGEELSESKFILNYIDKKLIQYIDALDSGFQVVLKQITSPYGIGDVTKSFLPIKNRDKKDYEKKFLEALDFAINLLKREIEIAKLIESSKKTFEEAVKKAKDKEYIVLEDNVFWREFIEDYPNLKFVIEKNSSGLWNLFTIRIDKTSFKDRKSLPAKWAGLEKEDLFKITGIENIIFCHKNRFLVVAETKESAIKLAELALKEK